MVLKRPKSLRDLSLEHLRRSIINGDLEMGQALSERKISEELGVSKSPVREAFARLRDEGLVIIEPQKGARVFTLTKDEVKQICDFRLAIETATFELALERNPQELSDAMNAIAEEMVTAKDRDDIKRYLVLDTQFHQLIFKYSENPYLSASYDQYVGKIAALRTHLSSFPKHTDLSLAEHQAIAQAVSNENLEEIRGLLKTHIGRSEQTYQEINNESEEDSSDKL